MTRQQLVSRIKNSSLVRQSMIDEAGRPRPVQEWGGDIEGYVDEIIGEISTYQAVRDRYLRASASLTTDGSTSYVLRGANDADDVGEIISLVAGTDGKPLPIMRSAAESQAMVYAGDYDTDDDDGWVEILGSDAQGRLKIRLQPNSSTGATVTYSYYKNVVDPAGFFDVLPVQFQGAIRAGTMWMLTGNQIFQEQYQSNIRRLQRVLAVSKYTASPMPLPGRIQEANIRTWELQSGNFVDASAQED